MSAVNDGGAAFPTGTAQRWGGVQQVEIQGGMSLRDYFAAKAMAAMLVNTDHDPQELAGVSYVIADAMLAARQEGGAA